MTIDGETYERTIELDRSGIDEKARTVPAALSSERIVQRFFGRELLQHTPAAINLERAGADGMPLLFNHRSDALIGRVREIRIGADNKLRGVLHFASNDVAAEKWRDVVGGFLTDISLGYRIDETVTTKNSDLVTASRWTPLEVSIVTIPADPTVGINRGMPARGSNMTTNQTDDTTAAAPALELVRTQATADGVRAERARVTEIRALFDLPAFRAPELRAIADAAVQSGSTIEQARAELLRAIGQGAAPLSGAPAPESETRRAGYVVGGRTEIEGFREGALESILVRSGIINDNETIARAATSEFRGMTMVDIARESLRRNGLPYRGMNRSQIIGEALTRGGLITHSTSDFANVLLDAANKSLILGYQEAPETWQMWCEAVSLPDFKPSYRIAINTFGDLDVIPELGEYKYGTFADSKESLSLKVYGKLFGISRRALIDDDTQAFTAIPKNMGRAANRMVGDEVYAITSGAGPTMGDTGALFNATAITTAGGHANLITAGGAPSVLTLNVGFTRMALVTDVAGGNVLNISPKYLVCSKSVENVARVLVAATYDPAGTAGTLPPNPFNGRLEVVADPRLDAIAAGAPWFLFADPRMFPTIQVGFLDGQQSPYLEQQEGFTQDGVIFKVRLDCVAGAVAWQGAFQNDGA